MIVGMAGEFASRVRAKNLIITHFSPRTFIEDAENDIEAIHRQTKESFKGPVFAAKDFWTFDIPKI